MKKRFLVLILLLLIALALPLLASAETQSGKCGDNLTWTLTDGGVLTISGTGQMKGYDKTGYYITTAPWGTSPEQVVIQNGVTSIGNDAFCGCSGLTSVTIPNSVTSIGHGAFSGCSSLTSVTIPNSVTSIDWCAFSGCSSLTSVTIPNSVTSIGDATFEFCSSLTSVTIPNSVTEINGGAFRRCSSLTSVTIPNSVTYIDIEAFYGCSSLTSVTIPNSVTSIGSDAFSGCSSLTSVTIPNSVTYIDIEAFYGCSSLTSVTIPNSVTSIDRNAFSGCSSLTSVTIEDGERHNSWGGTTYLSIDYSAFANCKNLTSITIPNCVGSIGSNAFSGCSKLKTVTIGNNCTISDHAFSGLGNLTTVTIGKNATGGSESIGDSAFSECPRLANLTIGRSIASIGTSAFSNCSALTSVTIPDSVSSIKGNAFYNCSNLARVIIPYSVTEIGYYAFDGCASGLTIVCSENTRALEYAQENNIKVELVANAALPAINAQPADVTVVQGETAEFAVTAEKADSYQWYYRTSASGAWRTVTNNGTFSSYSLTASAQNNGYQFRCKVTNEIGSIETEVVTLTVRLKPAITAQPASVTVEEGFPAAFTVAADHATGYQWYYRTSASGAWTAVLGNGASDSYSFTATASQNGCQYRCTVTNDVGSVNSKAVTLTVHPKPVITGQPKNLRVNAGETAAFTVTAQNAESYQWYYRKPATTAWVKVQNNGTAATYSLTAASMHNGYQFRCMVKNSVDYLYSYVAMLSVLSKPAVTTQPVSVTVNEGAQAAFTTQATNGAQYQWYTRASATSLWTPIDTDGNGASYSVAATAALNGSQYRCEASNNAGAVFTNVVTLTVKSKPAITAQPANQMVSAGENATFSVTAQNATAYQWYYRKSESDAWNRVVNNGTAAVYNLTTIASNNGFQFRCLVKNDAGSVYTNTVTLKVKPGITTQPTDKTVSAGETATFKVTATGAASYQWYYRKSASDAWNRVVNNGASAAYNLVTIASHNGYRFRCLVKNDAGSVYTNTVTLKVKPGITTQPTDKTVSAGETATFKVTATGAASYQWYYRKSASDAWNRVVNNGASNTYNLVTIASHNGYQFRCLVKNDAGSVYTNTVSLKVLNKPTITTQPTDKTVNAGETATFKVTASKATSYQWYYRKSASAAWIAVQNNGTANTYNLTTIASHNGYQFRCLVKNTDGGVYSNTVTLKVTNKPVITAQPTDQTVNIGETASFKVTAARATAYQWYYRKSESDVWNRVVNNGTSATYNLTTSATHKGYQFRCLVKNDEGSLYTNVATLTVTAKPTITVQPTDKTVNAGETATFKVTAARATSYQWYYRKTASSGWISVKNNGTSATYNLVTIAGNNGYQFRCEARNGEGTAVSDIVTLTVK